MASSCSGGEPNSFTFGFSDQVLGIVEQEEPSGGEFVSGAPDGCNVGTLVGISFFNGYASTTAITATTASTSALIISGAPGGLLKTSAVGVVSVATAGVDYLNSTTGDWSGTLGGYSAAQLIGAGFSTTSADAWKINRSFFSTTSAAYWKSQTDFFATTSADAWKGARSFFATTSSDYWLTQRTTDNLSQGSSNKYYATTLFASDLSGTTTDALAQGSTNKYWSNTLFDTRLSATTSLPNIITLANLSLPATQLSSFGIPFYQFFSATTSGRILGCAQEPFSAAIAAQKHATGERVAIETSINVQDWIAPQDFAALLDFSQFTASTTSSTVEPSSFIGRFLQNLFADITDWLASAENGIDKIFAHEIVATNGSFSTLVASSTTADTITANQKLCLGSRCMTAEQFNHILDMEAAAGAATAPSGNAGAPTAPPASGDASATSPTTSDTLKVNGNNPAEWQEGTPWQDNLGALFTHDGIVETIYSTSTVDTAISGTTTVDYWAVIPSSQQILHATRDVVIQAPANDNPPPTANDNAPIVPLAPTGTDATSTAQ